MNRLLIAGTGSGCGKTTVTLAVLAALQMRGMDVSSFKCGPDYIDPMFHRRVMGVSSHNLDPFFCDEEMLQRIFMTHAGGELSVIEGVMGYYDGIGPSGRASTYDVAHLLETPVVLVMNARGMAASAGAVLNGFLRYHENSRIRGVIFNGLSEPLYPMMAEIAHDAGVLPCGFLPRREDLLFENRHLGLVMAGEIKDIGEKIHALGLLAEAHIDIDRLIALAKDVPEIQGDALPVWSGAPRVRIAVSCDQAFCFLYRENIEQLEALGCEIVSFSPLADTHLPDEIGGLYLCGGYPELYVAELSRNSSMCRSVQAQIAAGLPTIAECGGFLYLHEELNGARMAGVIRGSAFETERLQRFGYITLKAERDNLLCARGQSIRAHEFHYYDSDNCGDSFTASKASRPARYSCVHASDSLYAGFPHLYFPANPAFAESFVRKAIEYEKNH
jgi:cobyrinic acid a,c-diamide synthase